MRKCISKMSVFLVATSFAAGAYGQAVRAPEKGRGNGRGMEKPEFQRNLEAKPGSAPSERANSRGRMAFGNAAVATNNPQGAQSASNPFNRLTFMLNSLGVQGDVPQTFISGKLNFLPTEALGKPNSGVSVSKMTQALVETGTYTARLRSDFNSGKADPSITAEVVDLAEQMVNVAAPTYVDALKTMDSLTGGQGLTSVDAQTRVALKTPALTSVFASVQLEAVLKESIEVKDLAAMKGYVARMRDLSQLVRSQQPIVNLFNQVENPTVANAKAVAFEKACGI